MISCIRSIYLEIFERRDVGIQETAESRVGHRPKYEGSQGK